MSGQVEDGGGVETGELFAAAYDASRMAMAITDPTQGDNPVVRANDAFLDLIGYRRDEVVGRNCRFMQGPGTDRATVDRLRAAVCEGRDLAVEILNYRKDGTPFWNLLHVSPVRDDAGRVSHYFSSQVDITDKKELEFRLHEAKATLEAEVERRTRDLNAALDAKDILLHEVDHRVKNNLQLVASLVSMQARRIPDPAVRASLARMLERVTALSMLHERLYQSSDLAVFDVGALARQLALDLLAASGRQDVRLRLDIEPLRVPAAKGAPLALALNELLVNALRHAFPDERAGVVSLGLRRLDGHFEVTVEDDGVGVDPLPPSGGFGSTLVRSLARQLHAEVDWEAGAAAGTRARLALPVDGHEGDAVAAVVDGATGRVG